MADFCPPEVAVHRASWTVDGTPVLREVTFTAPAGRTTGLIGPNGSGKTSLISLLARWTRPTSGRVLLDGVDAGSVPLREFARRVAALEQHTATELDLTVRQVVAMGRVPHSRRLGFDLDGGDDPVVARALARVGAAGLADRHWHTLSGGERQKVQVARVLAQEPRVLLLDELANHLDPAAGLRLLDLVRGLGLTTIGSFHDLNLAAMFCDRLVVLHRGRVVAEGTPRQVLTPALLGEVYGVEAVVDDHPATGGPLVVMCGAAREKEEG